MSFEAITTISDAENRARQIKADAQPLRRQWKRPRPRERQR